MLWIHPAPSWRRAGGLFGAAFFVLLGPGSALAHAELEKAEPADKAIIGTLPAEVVLVYSEKLADGSSATLRFGGATVATGVISATDGKVMTIPVAPDLAPGAYEIRWTSVAADGDVERGTLTFAYAPVATPEPTPTASPQATGTPIPASTATAAPTAEPTPTAALSEAPTATPAGGDSSGGASAADVALPIVGGLVVLGVLSIVLFRGRLRGGGSPG